MTNHETFKELQREVLKNKDARCAAHENELRRRLAIVFDTARMKENWSIRELAEHMGSSISQVRLLLHREIGGSLTLNTICRAADVLNIQVILDVPFLNKENSI